MIRNSLLFLILMLSSFNSYTQISKKVLIEEFTSAVNKECNEQSKYLDSLLNKNFSTVRIKYHTNLEGDNPLYNEAQAGIDKRLNHYGYINRVPQVIVDGLVRPEGTHPIGSTQNLTNDHIYDAGDVDALFSFSGIEHNFTSDFKEILVSGGGLPINGYAGKYSQALVEEVVNYDTPLGPDGQSEYTYVFRSWVKYRETLPTSGSFHGWKKVSIPNSVKSLSKLGVVHIVENSNGVTNAYYDPAHNVPDVKLVGSNLSSAQNKFYNDYFIPKMVISNKGIRDLSNFYLTIKINNSNNKNYNIAIRDTVSEILTSGESTTYLGDTIYLKPGQNNITIAIEGYDNGNIGIVNDPKINTFYVLGDYEELDEGFDSTSDQDSIGTIMKLLDNPFLFKNVSKEDFNTNYPIGAYGMSERCMYFDFKSWKFNFSNNDKNYAKLLLGRIDISNMKRPTLIMDVSGAGSDNANKVLKIKITSDKIIRKFNVNSAKLMTTPRQNNTYVPDEHSTWKEFDINLIQFSGHQFISIELEFRATSGVSGGSLDALYIDNMSIVDKNENCNVGNKRFLKQTTIDSFPLAFLGCSEITGNLHIGNLLSDTISSDINDLSPLNNLNYINGSITINGVDSIENMNGLRNLISIEKSLTISNNKNLLTIDGIDLLQHIGDDLIIKDNPNLSRIKGFKSVNEIQGDLILSDIPKLFYMGGIENINNIGGSVILKSLPKIPTLFKFKSLNSVGGSIILENIKGYKAFEIKDLDTLHGSLILDNIPTMYHIKLLPNTKVIEGDLIINGAGVMTNLDWLKTVEYVNGSVEINNISKLKNLDGLENLISIGNNLTISGSDSITMINRIQGLRYIGGSIKISNLARLKDFSSLPSLDTILGDLSITDCDSLIQMSGLKGLGLLKGSFSLLNNKSLENLDDIKSWTAIEGNLYIHDNILLNDVKGISNLDHSLLSTNGNGIAFSLINNEQLSYCENNFICNFVKEKPSELIVEGNAIDCSSIEEINISCTNSSIEDDKVLFHYSPNPFRDYLDISIDHDTNYKIYNQLGLLIKKGQLKKGHNTINLKVLNKGLYLLIIDENHELIRILKQ